MSRLTLGPGHHGQPLMLAVGESVTLELPEVPTSGYRWRVVAGAGAAGDVLAVQASDTLPPAAGRVGGQALRRLVVVAQAAGVGVLRLELHRPGGGPPAPGGVFEVTVTVG